MPKPQPTPTAFLAGALLMVAAVLLQACAHYKLGHAAELPFKSIYIRPATNDAFAPQAQATVSAQVRQALIRDGRVEVLADEDRADAVLLVNLTDYRREAAARGDTDTVRARDFDVTLAAAVSLFDATEGRFLFKDRTLVESSVAYADNPYADDPADTQSYVQAEYQAMPRLARGLARKIADEVLGAW